MHEFSIAEDILAAAEKELEKNKLARIKKIEIEVGELMMANLEQLDFALKSLAVDTPSEDMEVELRYVPAKFKCSNGHVNEIPLEGDLYMALAYLRCPDCGEPVSVLSGKECIIKRIIAE